MKTNAWRPKDPSGEVRFSPPKSVWLWFHLGVGLAFGWPPSPFSVALSLGLTFLTLCVGHSVGLHRLVIHESYRAPRWLERALVYAFVHTGLGGPLSWMEVHALRDRAQNGDGHSPYLLYEHGLARDFVWNLHFSYVPKHGPLAERHRRDPWLRFLEWSWPIHVAAGVVGLALLFGPEVAATAGCLRVAVGILGHWWVGYVSHTYGERRYAIAGAREEGRNHWLLGLLSFGEGFHNNHHARPNSARMGERPGELDLGYLVIRLMERMGWIWGVHHRTPLRSGAAPSPNASFASVGPRVGDLG